MARTWLSIEVELLGGRGEDLSPAPGRIFAVGPSHTFAQLARAVDDAFARWDRAHLHLFELRDGRLIGSPSLEWDREIADEERTKVARSIPLGGEFRYTFDLSDDWRHRCKVAAQKVDPLDVLGIVPPAPSPYWGWGSIPDQYGRSWRDDDGETPPPAPEPLDDFWY